MLLLLIAVYSCINMTGLFPRGSDARQALKTWHFMLGLSVLALVLLRLLNRYAGPVPQVIPPLPLWQQRASALTHALLYAFMVIMPLLGWLTLSASGKVIPFFGFELPALLTPDKDLAEQLKEVHETVGTVGYFLLSDWRARAGRRVSPLHSSRQHPAPHVAEQNTKAVTVSFDW